MKLFVIDSATQQKIYLNLIASTRTELATLVGSPWFSLSGQSFYVNNVIAEADENNITSGAVFGGLIGLLGGPIGILVGGLIGGILGNEGDEGEKQKVNYFNSSRV
jgi:hypothetical protein